MSDVELPDDDEVDHGGTSTAAGSQLPPDPTTAGGNPYKPTQLPKLESDARLVFCRKVYAKLGGKRDPEGAFDFDTNKWQPTVREDLGVDPPRQTTATRLRGWAHVYYLCQRAIEGKDVPPDIAKFRDELWPKVHAEFFEGAVEKAEKAASEKHEKQQRMAEKRAKLLAEAAVKESREFRIKQAEERVANYDKGIAKLQAKVKALETRKKRALRSIRALKRFEEKEGK